jgi:hypothetical protein
MITTKLSAVMLAMTALVAAGPMAVFAQDDNESEAESFLGNVNEQINAASVETGRNTQAIVQDQEVKQSNTIAVVADRGGEAEIEADDIDQDNDAVAIQSAQNNLDDRDDVDVDQDNDSEQEVEDSFSIAAALAGFDF